MSIFTGTRALFVAPHTDDAELGCGATLARCLNECEKVDVVAFSSAAASLPLGSTTDRLVQEFRDAMDAYGIPKSGIHIYDFPVRYFDSHRQEILEKLIELRRFLEPTLVFIPAKGDVHQDHQVIHNECVRAFKNVSIFGYELPWNHFHFESNAFIEVSADDMESKLKALRCYSSQVEKGRGYFDSEFITGLARVRGLQYGVAQAEAFQVITLKV